MPWLENLCVNLSVFFLETTCFGFRPKPPQTVPPSAIIIPENDLFGARREGPRFYYVPSVSDDSYSDSILDEVRTQPEELDGDDCAMSDGFEIVDD